MKATGIMKNPHPNRERAIKLNPSPAQPALPTKLKTDIIAKIKAEMPQMLFLVSWEISNLDSGFLRSETGFSFFLDLDIERTNNE